MQLQSVLGYLEHYKSTNHHLQFEIKKQEINNMLTKKENHQLKESIKQLTTQIEELRNAKHSTQNLQGQNIEKKTLLKVKTKYAMTLTKQKDIALSSSIFFEDKAYMKRKGML